MLPFRPRLLACTALVVTALSAARGAVTISDVNVTNVGATTFTVVWKTSETSTPGLDVFSDATGTAAITATVSLDYYPVGMGDPGVVDSSSDRASRRALQLVAMQECVVAVRVSGLAPDTTYYVRPRTYGAGGADNASAVTPLTAATTAQQTSLVGDARLLRVHVPTFNAHGMILLVQGPAGTTPLSAIVGDSDASDVAVLSTAWIIDTSTHTNALFTTPQSFVIRAIGKDAPASTFTQTITFTSDFVAAAAIEIEANITSPAPFFTQPPMDVTVITGGTASFSAVVTGDPSPTLQWQRKPAGGTTWSDLADDGTYSGVKTATLSVLNAQPAMTGDQFRLVATNGVPPDATSSAATLTVSASAVAPVISTQPASAAVVAGSAAVFNVVATGTPAPTYRWQRKPSGSTTWANLDDGGTYAGTTTATLTVSGTTIAMSGDQFRVVVSNEVAPDATSGAALLTVSATAIAPAITTQPAPMTAGIGGTVQFTVTATGTPTPSYRWQIELAGSSSWLDLTETANYRGVATAALTVKNATAAMSGDTFRVVVANGTPPDATSNGAVLTVQPLPSISAQPAAVSVVLNGTASFTVAASGTGALAYAWQRLPAGTTEWQPLADDAMYAGTTSSTLRVLGAQVAMNGDQFRCVVTDSVGSTASDAAVLTVTQAVATLTLTGLQQFYDGTPRVVSATTNPAGLDVVITYDGRTDAPVCPGMYDVSATIHDVNYSGTAAGKLTITTGVLARHIVALAGHVNGSVQLGTAEDTTVAGVLSGDLLVPGTPLVSGTVATAYGPGAVDPSTYTVTFTAGAAARNAVLRIDAPLLPTVAAPPAPTGTRLVTLTAAGQSAGDFSTIRNLTVTGTAGNVAVPPGTYGNLTANGSAALVLGIAGATEPAVYNLQALAVNTLRASAKLLVVGPVVINVAGTTTLYGDTGSADHPEWLAINAYSGGVSTNMSARLWGHVLAPASTVTLTGTSTIIGTVITDKLNLTTSATITQAP